MKPSEFIMRVKCAQNAAEVQRLLHIEFPQVAGTPAEKFECFAAADNRVEHFMAAEEGALVTSTYPDAIAA